MKWLAALLVAIGLWFAPLGPGSHGAASLHSDEGSYRMRMCELALFSGESPRSDQLLEARAGQDVPYGAFAPAATAFALARLLPRDAFDLERGELDEDALANGARRLMLVLAWLASLAIALASSKFGADGLHSPNSSHQAIALAADFDGGSVRSTGWGLILCAAVLGGAALLSRPRELADQVGLAIGLGLLSGLALANDLFAWPSVLAPLVVLALRARAGMSAERRDALRTAVFFVATALIVSVLRTPWPAGSSPLPRFEPAWPAQRGSAAEVLIDVACLALGAWLILGGPRSVPRRTLALVLVTSFVLRSIDARFASAVLAPAGLALAWCVRAAWFECERRWLPRAITLATLALLASFAALHDERSHSADAIRALRELRQSTPPSGAWNHAGARQDYAVLANPRMAGAIVFHARRAVCGALLPGASASAAAREAAGALLSETSSALAERAKSLHARYVIVARHDLERMRELALLSDRAVPALESDRGQGSVLQSLLVDSEAAGFQLVRRVPSRTARDGVAELAVWRLLEDAAELAPASMSAR